MLIYSGLLYLLGISIVLAFKPEIMFTKEGNWKEFGLGRANGRYTWLPFWLFTILWAILSYMIVLVIASHTGLAGVTANSEVPVTSNTIEPENVSMKAMTPVLQEGRKRPSTMGDMKKGYYILDANETMKKGIPKYIYLGPEAPNLVYHHDIEHTGE